MDQVLAKVKRLRKEPFHKLLSDTTLYEAVDLDTVSLVDYNTDHNLDEDAWFKIEEFSSKDYFLTELAVDVDTKDYNELSKEKFKDITCLLGIQGGDVYFQKVISSSFIKRKLIHFGEVAHIEDSSDRIVVKSIPDAVFIRDKDMLLFKEITSVASIFKGIDQLYKEATAPEVQAFLEADFIKLDDAYDHSSVSKPNRKRIALANEALAKMTKGQRAGLIPYIQGYCKEGVPLSKDGKQFLISSDTQLKLVLYGIQERFYTTEHGQEKRLANSVEVMD